MCKNEKKISIGVITHTPYLNNYKTLMDELIMQTEKSNNIELVVLIQTQLEFENNYEGENIHEYVSKKIMTPSEARNFIITHTSGDWIAYIDGDCEIGDKYFEALVKAVDTISGDEFAIQGSVLASVVSKFGRYEFIYDVISLLEIEAEIAKDFFKTKINDENKILKDYYMKEEVCNVRKLQGFNFAISRKTIQEIGEFNEQIETAEDRDYSLRIIDQGKKIKFVPLMEVYHGYDMSLKRILVRKKWHALGCADLRKKNNEVYDSNIMERIKYAFNIFLNCKKIDFLFYKISTDVVFWNNVKKEMKKELV